MGPGERELYGAQVGPHSSTANGQRPGKVTGGSFIKGGIWQMTSCHVITGHAASAGNSMMRFCNTTPATVVTKRRLLVSRAVNHVIYGL